MHNKRNYSSSCVRYEIRKKSIRIFFQCNFQYIRISPPSIQQHFQQSDNIFVGFLDSAGQHGNTAYRLVLLSEFRRAFFGQQGRMMCIVHEV